MHGYTLNTTSINKTNSAYLYLFFKFSELTLSSFITIKVSSPCKLFQIKKHIF